MQYRNRKNKKIKYQISFKKKNRPNTGVRVRLQIKSLATLRELHDVTKLTSVHWLARVSHSSIFGRVRGRIEHVRLICLAGEGDKSQCT